MASVSTSRSLFESFFWKGVWQLLQKRVIGWFASSQGEDAKPIGIEIDLCTDKAMQPMLIDSEGMPQEIDAAFVVGASEVDDFALRMFLQVQSPSLGKRASQGRRFDPRGSSAASGE